MVIRFLKKIRISLIMWKYRKILHVGSGFSCGRGTIFYARNKIRVGTNVYVGRNCNFECDSDIGNEVLIANNVGIIGRLDHDYSALGVPIRFSPSVRDADYSVPPEKSKVIIGDDVWVGYGAIVLSGANIGSGSVIAAGSTVICDVEPFSIVAGCPARKVGERFDKADSERHKALCRSNYSSYKLDTEEWPSP